MCVVWNFPCGSCVCVHYQLYCSKEVQRERERERAANAHEQTSVFVQLDWILSVVVFAHTTRVLRRAVREVYSVLESRLSVSDNAGTSYRAIHSNELLFATTDILFVAGCTNPKVWRAILRCNTQQSIYQFSSPSLGARTLFVSVYIF